MPQTINPQLELINDLAAFTHDPYKFVIYAFPWGEPGELKEYSGPEEWQTELLCDVRDKLKTPHEAIREAAASGHGVGKSALASWLILWAIATHEDTRGVITANTEVQLRTKTWAELSKWHRLFIARHWFQLTATAIYSVDPKHERTWRIDCIPWSEHKTEAFAGLHNKGNRILVIFDESSAIPDAIWEVSEGALTDENTEILWFAFGNPTRTGGAFRRCFDYPSRWTPRRVDSRDCKITNKVELEKWRQEYGDESDFFRVRVRGEHPLEDTDVLIPRKYVDALKDNNLVFPSIQRIIAVDPSLGGDKCAVHVMENYKVLESIGLYHRDTMKIVAELMILSHDTKINDFAIDSIGIGKGIVDRLRELGKFVQAINSSEKAHEAKRFANRRAEMWWGLRESIYRREIPEIENKEIVNDICAVRFSMNSGMKEIALEPKKETKKTRGHSPDDGDAFVYGIEGLKHVKKRASEQDYHYKRRVKRSKKRFY